MASRVLDRRQIAWVLGGALGALGLGMLLTTLFAWLTTDPMARGLLHASAVTLLSALGLLAAGYRRPRRDLRQREIILLVSVIWLGVTLFGALPLWLSPHYDGFAAAFFESASGFTTTGATVLPDVEVLTPALHLWRSLSHWFGGMGIVLLGLAILPILGSDAPGLYRAEFSGAAADRLRPRIAETVRALWKIYVALTGLLWLALWAAGMTAFEAFCHALSTLASGGFSTHTASIGAWQSPLIEYIVILFMFAAGVSFVQHYRLWVQRDYRVALRDLEFRAYVGILLLATVLILAARLPGLLAAGDGLAGWEPWLRATAFQVISITTTTGFATADYTQWPPLAQMLLLVLMFIGGCTGSTAGGLKTARMLLMLRVIGREFARITEPRGVFRIRMDGHAVSESAISGLLTIIYLGWLVLLLGTLVLTATGVDVLTALSAVAASQFNVGPGLGAVGPAGHYGDLHPVAQSCLALCMIAGRLEFYTALIILTPTFWRR